MSHEAPGVLAARRTARAKLNRVTREMVEVSFDCSLEERKIALKIARRAQGMLLEHKVKRSFIDIQMDIIATHCNGNPLRLDDLLAADDFNFLHDLAGIARHLDRNTGKLGGCFSPRFSDHRRAA